MLVKPSKTKPMPLDITTKNEGAVGSVQCQQSNFIWDFYLTRSKTGKDIISKLSQLFSQLDRQYGIKPKEIWADREITKTKPEVER